LKAFCSTFFRTHFTVSFKKRAKLYAHVPLFYGLNPCFMLCPLLANFYFFSFEFQIFLFYITLRTFLFSLKKCQFNMNVEGEILLLVYKSVIDMLGMMKKVLFTILASKHIWKNFCIQSCKFCTFHSRKNKKPEKTYNH